MGRKKRPTKTKSNEKELIIDNEDSGVSITETSSCRTPSAGFLRLKPISALLCEDSNSISTLFSFSENSISNHGDFETKPEPASPSFQTSAIKEVECVDGCDASQGTSSQLETKPIFITPTKPKFRKKLNGHYHKVTDFFNKTPRCLNKTLAFMGDKENISNNQKKPLTTIDTSERGQCETKEQMQIHLDKEENPQKTSPTVDAEVEIKTQNESTNNPRGCSDEIPSMNDLGVAELKDDDVISIASSISDDDDPQYVPENDLIRMSSKSRGTKLKEKAKTNSRKNIKKLTPRKTRSQKPVCPNYKIIGDTSFAVDAFRFGVLEGVTHYFLSHFHSDHYVGLKRDFSHPIYMSEITANLVRKIIKVKDEHIRPMELNIPVMVGDIEVTALDANHCPGAVMFVFKLASGKCILHTGDFRATPEMETEPIFWNNHIHTIYLDTTYLPSKSDHPKQMDSITEMLNAVQRYRTENIGEKYVIVVGTYVIGKERVWASLARELGCKVWLEKKRLEAVECYEDASLLELLETDATKALIHVLPLQNLFYENLIKYLGQFDDIYTKVLAIRPTGWEKKQKLQKRGRVTILGVPYSEHSSYSELERFIRHLKPDEVISTVPLGSNLSKVPSIPAQWLSKELIPKRSGQQAITTFFKGSRSSLNNSCVENDIDKHGSSDEQELHELSMCVHVDQFLRDSDD